MAAPAGTPVHLLRYFRPVTEPECWRWTDEKTCNTQPRCQWSERESGGSSCGAKQYEVSGVPLSREAALRIQAERVRRGEISLEEAVAELRREQRSEEPRVRYTGGRMKGKLRPAKLAEVSKGGSARFRADLARLVEDAKEAKREAKQAEMEVVQAERKAVEAEIKAATATAVATAALAAATTTEAITTGATTTGGTTGFSGLLETTGALPYRSTGYDNYYDNYDKRRYY